MSIVLLSSPGYHRKVVVWVYIQNKEVTMPAMTRLDAVNRMLTAAGEQAVNTLLADGTNDVDLAESILDDAILEIQSKGMGFNTEVKKFYKDSNNQIAISDNILSITPWGEDFNRDLTQRGNLLYDRYYNRNTFPDDAYIQLKVTYKLDFDEIPSDIQYWIADFAARNYQMQTQRSREQDAYLAERLLRSEARAKAFDMQNRNDNYNQNFNGNTGWGTSRYRYGFRGPR